jgi:nitroimidazol reductase NimA-like FMN-containing flavoprotein (pyridoxamine 5'-phosphate oxidase superfamily)
MGHDEDAVRVLSREECWLLLRRAEFGRLAFRMLDEIHLVPLNYGVDGDKLLFRTAEGDKLLGIVMHPDVVFEIDDHDEHNAHSVIVRGTARRLDEHEQHRADDIGLRSWLGTLKYDVVEITPTSLSGRAFRLGG